MKIILFSSILILLALFLGRKLMSRHKLNQKIKKVNELFEGGRFEEATLLLKEAYQLDKTNLNVLEVLGTSLHNQEQYEEAIEYLNKLINSGQNALKFKIMLANCYYNMEQYDEAIEILQKLKNYDSSLKVIQILGASFAAQKDYDSAIEVYKKAPMNNPDLVEELIDLHYNLGISYEGNGDLENALKHFYNVYAVDKNYRDVAFIISDLESIQ